MNSTKRLTLLVAIQIIIHSGHLSFPKSLVLVQSHVWELRIATGNTFVNESHTFTSQSVTIKLPPTNFSWAYEMQVEDPDGNVLRLGSDPNSDELELVYSLQSYPHKSQILNFPTFAPHSI